MERAARIAGSRFGYWIGDAALLALAMYRLALDRLVAKGFVPVLPPVLVREEALVGTGWLPSDDPNVYAVEGEDLYLAGTAEIPVGGLHLGELLQADELPLRYVGFSPCFRSEAGAAGRDTRGMFRVHQFNKVEQFAFTRPEDSWEEHERLLSNTEEIVAELEVPYRVVVLPTGDMSKASAKTYDVEIWFPSQDRYRETASISNTTDFQARRLGTRFRAEHGPEPVHTLNGTAVVDRMALAVLENFQGGVPDVLREYGAPARDPLLAVRSVTMRVGGVPERSNGAVLKTVGRASASWVRIPPPPWRSYQYAERMRASAGRVSMISRMSSRRDQFVTYR